MAIAKIVGAQRDFSAGELDLSTKRADENPIVKTGGRQMLNWRILSSKALANRPGRDALFPTGSTVNTRIEEIIMPGGSIWFLGFGANALGVFNSTGTLVFVTNTLLLTPAGSPVGIPWTALTLGGIVWAQIGRVIYITYPDGAPNNTPQVLTFDGVSTWTLAPYTETTNAFSGQKRTLFYRISPPSITMQPSATTGSVSITFSSAVLSAGMVGTRMRFCERQLTITAVADALHGTATVNEPLPPGQSLTYTTLNGRINIGDVVIGATTGAHGIVTGNAFQQTILTTSGSHYVSYGNTGDTVTQAATASTGQIISGSYYFDGSTFYVWTTVNVTAGAFNNASAIVGPLQPGGFTPLSVTTLNSLSLTVQLIPTGTGDVSQIIQFAGSETVAGPSGSFALTGNSIIAPQAVTVWDDEVMNLFRGYPASTFADQSRLGFCNFPSVQAGIAWSAIGLPLDLYVGALPDDAIFELAPDNSQVLFVIAGMESAEFAFCDRAIFYIPITPTIPLQPGSVAFNKLSDYGCLPKVQPRRAEQSIIYFKAGGAEVGAVQNPGAYYRPYVVDGISDLHAHLFALKNPIAIAIPSGSIQFNELYIYVALGDGTLVLGHYNMRQGLIEPGPEGKPAVGWLPWTGAGFISWVAARQGDVIFATTYGGSNNIAEKLDATAVLDGELSVNSLPAPFTPPGGKGPLYVFPGPGSTVSLFNNGTPFFQGTYQVDANGFIIPQFIANENLSSPNLIAGLGWSATFEPWAPDAPPGQGNRQRLLRRRISHMAVRATQQNGLILGRLFSGPLTPTSPAYGTLENFRLIPAFNVGDNVNNLPPVREETYRWRPIGRSFDPRVQVGKITPGALLLHELGLEITV